MIDIIGKKYGRLTVVSFAFIRKKHSYWNCICDCGNEKIVESSRLRGGHTKSCGCLQREKARIIALNFLQTHHLTGNRIFNIWRGIKARCYNPHRPAYKNYGGRGIKMCDEWRDNALSFYNWSLENGYEPHLTIDRIDNNGDYSPQNCKWSTASEQAFNRRKKRYMYNGILYSARELADLMGWKSTTSVYRQFESVCYE